MKIAPMCRQCGHCRKGHVTCKVNMIQIMFPTGKFRNTCSKATFLQIQETVEKIRKVKDHVIGADEYLNAINRCKEYEMDHSEHHHMYDSIEDFMKWCEIKIARHI